MDDASYLALYKSVISNILEFYQPTAVLIQVSRGGGEAGGEGGGEGGGENIK